MKAKEYIEKYKDRITGGITNESLNAMFKEFTNECNEEVAKRNIKRDSAVLSILDEFDKKWKAVARGIENVNPDGFYLIWKDEGLDFRKRKQDSLSKNHHGRRPFA